MSDAFFIAVKEKRNEALAFFNERIEANGGIFPVEELSLGIDSLVSGVLDVVEEQYESIVTASTDDEDTIIDLTIVSNLSTLFMEEVNT